MAEREWTVSIVAERNTPGPKDLAADIAERLQGGAGGAVSVEPGRVTATFAVRADGLDDALEEARAAWAELGSDAEAMLVGLHVDATEEIQRAVERRLAPLDLVDSVNLAELLAGAAGESAFDAEPPALLGTAEVAETLEVSKARVSALQRRATFPRPLARLRSGPVWSRAAIENYLARHRSLAPATESPERTIEASAWLGQAAPRMQH